MKSTIIFPPSQRSRILTGTSYQPILNSTVQSNNINKYQLLHWNIQGHGQNKEKQKNIIKTIRSINPIVIGINEPYSYSPSIDNYHTIDALPAQCNKRSKLNCSLLLHQSLNFRLIKKEVNLIVAEIDEGIFSKRTTIIYCYLLPC